MDTDRQRPVAIEATGSAEGQMMRNKNQAHRICDPRSSAAVRHEPTPASSRYERTSCCVALVISTVAAAAFAAQPTSPPTLEEELASFRFADPQLKIELVVAEPDVISPVAMAWDADGRLFVAEMMDYPTAPTRGRIRLLEDRDGDGHYERASVFADKLAFPNGVMPWKDGVLVTAAPDIWFLKDTDGDGAADERRVLLTGFAQGNQQLRANGLLWGLDNWIYGANGRSEGEVRWADVSAGNKLNAKSVSIRGRDFRFRPEDGKFEAIAGRSQFGLARDDWGNRFLSWNTIPIRHEVLPERYLSRSPHLAVTESLADIIEPGDNGRVFPLAPPPLTFNNESVQHFNALAGLTIFRGDALGEKYRGNAFAGESLLSLVHRRVLAANGTTFIAKRGEDGKEFLASSDPWFHPVNFATGPDGALYVVDFYRRFVEHPDYVHPKTAKEKIDWREGAQYGRIWRITLKESKLKVAKPALGRASASELVKYLANENGWWRDTAQRLLVERQDRSVSATLENLAQNSSSPVARLHALYTLDGLGASKPELIASALSDPHPRIREHAARLSERFISNRDSSSEPASAKSAPGATAGLIAKLFSLVNDPDPRVRFQLALALGELEDEQKLPILAQLVQVGVTNRWQALAVLTSVGDHAWVFWQGLTRRQPAWFDAPTSEQVWFVEKLAALVGASATANNLREATNWLKQPRDRLFGCFVLLTALHDNAKTNSFLRERLSQVSAEPADRGFRPDDLRRAAAQHAASPNPSLSVRLAAVRLLGKSDASIGGRVLCDLLLPGQPGEIQSVAVKALAELNNAETAVAALGGWSRYLRSTRQQLLAAATGSSGLAAALLDTLDRGEISPLEVAPSTRQALQKIDDAQLKPRIEKLFKSAATPDREQVIRDFQPALRMPADRRRGAAVFAKACLGCHSIQGVGKPVGADLSGLASRAKEALLVDILDPSRQVSPDFLSYALVTARGETLTGLIASETATSVTVRRQGLPDETVLRDQIKEFRAEGKSLMPDGLEQGLAHQDMADLLEFLRQPDAALLPKEN
jgi:putative membrane-bound dehydrogenase-like protein